MIIQKVDIRVLLVEYSHLDKKRLLDMMNGFGYDNPFNLPEDMVFVKRGQFWENWPKTFHAMPTTTTATTTAAAVAESCSK